MVGAGDLALAEIRKGPVGRVTAAELPFDYGDESLLSGPWGELTTSGDVAWRYEIALTC